MFNVDGRNNKFSRESLDKLKLPIYAAGER